MHSGGMPKQVVQREVHAQLIGLFKRDNWRNFLFIGVDWLVIIGAAAMALMHGMNPIAYGMAVFLIGSRQRGLMNLVHEAAHFKLFANRRLNETAGRLLTAYPLLISLSAYRSGHRRHHGWLWDSTKDPDAIDYERFGLRRPPDEWGPFVRNQLVAPVLYKYLPHTLRTLLSRNEERVRETFWRLAWVCAVVAAILVSGTWKLVLVFWVVPFCTSLMLIWYLAFVGKHAGLETDDPFQATRNWTGSTFTRWLLAPHSDDLYHLVHHLYPAIPHYRLRAAHRLLMTKVPLYAAAHHCDGFFFPRRPEAPSVLQDVLHRRTQRVSTPASVELERGTG